MANKKDLKPGDILLFRSTHRSTLSERLIVWGQKTFYHVPKNARYCHVALVDKDTDFMLEAVWPKTRISKIDFSSHKQREKMEIYRVRGITDEQIEKTLAWAHNHLGEWYDIPLFLTGWIDIKHAEVCSTFVTHCFESASLEIPHVNDDQKLILPDDFYGDDVQLEKIG